MANTEKSEVDALRALLAMHRGPRTTYLRETRERAMAVCAAALRRWGYNSTGRTRVRIKRDTLGYWRQRSAARRSETKTSPLRRVRVVDDVVGAPSIRVQHPTGLRIEGLTIETLAALLKALA